MVLKRAAAFFMAFSFVFLLTSCSKGSAKNADKTINYNLAAEPGTLDPQVAADTSSVTVIQALFEGLTRLDANDKPVPGVAAKWDPNADSTQFTFTLRSDAKWSNKEPVTANDFVFAFRRALDPKTGSTTGTQMYCIKNARKVRSGQLSSDQLGAVAKDSHTLVIDLETSCPDFAKLAASPVYMPCNEKFFQSTAGRYGLEYKYLLGNGPFAIDGRYGWEHGKFINLQRSDTYAGQRKPLPSAINFSIGDYVNVSDPIAALKSNAVDAIGVTYSQAEAASAVGCTITSYQDSTWGLCFNTQSKIFKNKNVRSAFLQSFSRSAVLSHLPGNTAAAENIVLPGTSLDGQTYRSLAGGPFYLKQSPGAAQTLNAGLKDLGLSKMESVTVICPDDPNVKLMLNEMISSWNSQFDNYFNMEPLAEDKLLERVKSGDYDIAFSSVTPSGDGPSAALSLFCSSSSENPAMWKDPTYDSLVAATQTKSGKAAASYYASAEKRLNEQAVFYPLYYGKSYYALAKGVTGIIFHAYQGGADFMNAGKE